MSRGKNFSKEEISVLLTSLENSPDLVSGELGKEYKTPQEMKTAWENVAAILSACSLGITRTGTQVKNKWIDLKCRTRKRVGEINSEIKKTGGGPNGSQPLSDIEKRVIGLIGSTSVEGIIPIGGDLTAHQILPVSESLEPATNSWDQTVEDLDPNDLIFTDTEEDECFSRTSVICTPRNASTVEKKSTHMSFQETPHARPSVSGGSSIKRQKTSVERVRRYRQKRKNMEINENEALMETIVETQKNMKEALCRIDENVKENNNTLTEIYNVLKEQNRIMLNLSNNLTIFSGLLSSHLGIPVTNVGDNSNAKQC